jgi:hypothetical protein
MPGAANANAAAPSPARSARSCSSITCRIADQAAAGNVASAGGGVAGPSDAAAGSAIIAEASSATRTAGRVIARPPCAA